LQFSPRIVMCRAKPQGCDSSQAGSQVQPCIYPKQSSTPWKYNAHEFRACLHEWVIFSRFLMQGMNPAHSFINLIFSKNFISYPKVVRKEEGSCTYSLRPVGILQLQVGLRHPPPPSPTQLPNLLIIFPCAGIFHNVETHIWLGWCPCFLLTGNLEQLH